MYSSFRLFKKGRVLFLLLCFFTITPQTYTQNSLLSNYFNSSDSHIDIIQMVLFSFHNTPLREALTAFSEHTGIILVYSMDEMKLNHPVRAEIYHKPPLIALQEIISGTGLEVMLSSTGRIVLIPRISDYKVNGGVTGKVVDHQTGSPIPRVNIYLEELQLGTMTNNDGLFNIPDLPEGSYTIHVSHIAYEPVRKELLISPEESHVTSLALNPATFNFGDIIIDAHGTFLHEGGVSVSGTKIGHEEIAQTGHSGIGQVLRTRVAGVTFFEYGAGTGSGHLQFRGVGSFYNPIDYVRINVDGIPVDGIYWETFVTDNLSRIEILRGPQASGQYGSNAMSGVINLYTDTGREGTVRARISAAGGLAKGLKSDFDPLWQEYFGSVSGGSDVITSGITIRHTRDEGILANRESRLTSVTAGTMIKPSGKFSVTGTFRFSELGSGWPYSQNIQTLPDISLINPNISSRQQRGIVSMNADVGLFSWWNQKFTIGSEYLYGNLQYETNEGYYSGENGTVQERWVTMHERDIHLRPTIHYNSKFILPMGNNERATFSGGIEIQREERSRDIRREEDGLLHRTFDGGSEQTTIGKYLSWSFQSAQDLDVTVGFRMDQIHTEEKVFKYPMSPSLNIGYRFDVSNNWVALVRGSVGRGIRHPHYSMIFGRPPVEIPNPDLSAEIMDGWETGFSNYLLDGKLTLSGTFFSQETRDAFQPVSMKDETNAYQWINGGRVINQGLEIEAYIVPTQWVQIGITHIFHWNKAIDFRQEDPYEYTLLRIPDIAGSLFMAFQPNESLSFNFDLYYVGERLDVDLEAWHSEGRIKPLNDYEKMFPLYLKLDFFGRFVVYNNHELFLNIYNFLNDMSREYSGMPPTGRMIILGIRYNI